MSLIDWSDPEEMLGLLAEYVDDAIAANTDRDRAAFLDELRRDLASAISGEDSAVDALRQIDSDQSRDFRDDDVLIHLRDCIAELERIG